VNCTYPNPFTQNYSCPAGIINYFLPFFSFLPFVSFRLVNYAGFSATCGNSYLVSPGFCFGEPDKFVEGQMYQFPFLPFSDSF
jgi:hypothetical protein